MKSRVNEVLDQGRGHQNSKIYVAIALSALFLSLLTGFQYLAELRVLLSGTSTPRNYREQVIFDYFHAMREKRCQNAYELRAYHLTTMSHDAAIQNCMETKFLPVRISIGKEDKRSLGSERCGYGYVIYVAEPGEWMMKSGQIGLVDNPNKPGSCQVSYNSAFGTP
ncbi:MAG: hypothetical protein RBJ76_11910 [Stenomitos frigidus ULC029]